MCCVTTDDNIEWAKNQCAELVKTDNYTSTQFSKALYPHLYKDDHTQLLQHPPLPRPAHAHPGFSESSTVQEDLSQTSKGMQCTCINLTLKPTILALCYFMYPSCIYAKKIKILMLNIIYNIPM